jgi:hypothetical protein
MSGGVSGEILSRKAAPSWSAGYVGAGRILPLEALEQAGSHLKAVVKQVCGQESSLGM